jgi:hypothetical protein
MMELISEELDHNSILGAVTLVHRRESRIDQNGTVFEFALTCIDLSTGMGYSVAYGN